MELAAMELAAVGVEEGGEADVAAVGVEEGGEADAQGRTDTAIETFMRARKEGGVSADALRTYVAACSLPLGAGAPEWARWHDELVRWHRAGTPLELLAIETHLALETDPEPGGLPPADDGIPLPDGFARLRDPSVKGARVKATEQRGLTILQLEALFAEGKRRCTANGWRDKRTGKRVTAKTLNLYHMVDFVVKPATEAANCSAAELVSSHAQLPQWFVSHWWGEPVADFITCLKVLCADKGLPIETTTFWVCAYALNQHDVEGELRGGVQDSPFVRALLLADGAVSIVDSQGQYFTRCAHQA
jgi:hypothetical protein